MAHQPNTHVAQPRVGELMERPERYNGLARRPRRLRRSLLGAASAGLLVLGIASCSGNSSDVTSPAGPATTTTQPETTTSQQLPDPPMLVPTLNGPTAPLSMPTAKIGSLDDAQAAMPFKVFHPDGLGEPKTVKFNTSVTPEVGLFWSGSAYGPLLATEAVAASLKTESDLKTFAKGHDVEGSVTKISFVHLRKSGAPALLFDGDGPRAVLFLVGKVETNVLISHDRSDDEVLAAADSFAALGT